MVHVPAGLFLSCAFYNYGAKARSPRNPVKSTVSMANCQFGPKCGFAKDKKLTPG
jgi:hypothetical protein